MAIDTLEESTFESRIGRLQSSLMGRIRLMKFFNGNEGLTFERLKKYIDVDCEEAIVNYIAENNSYFEKVRDSFVKHGSHFQKKRASGEIKNTRVR